MPNGDSSEAADSTRGTARTLVARRASANERNNHEATKEGGPSDATPRVRRHPWRRRPEPAVHLLRAEGDYLTPRDVCRSDDLRRDNPRPVAPAGWLYQPRRRRSQQTSPALMDERSSRSPAWPSQASTWLCLPARSVNVPSQVTGSGQWSDWPCASGRPTSLNERPGVTMNDSAYWAAVIRLKVHTTLDHDSRPRLSTTLLDRSPVPGRRLTVQARPPHASLPSAGPSRRSANHPAPYR